MGLKINKLNLRRKKIIAKVDQWIGLFSLLMFTSAIALLLVFAGASKTSFWI
ncbi:hypothetical protein PFLA_b0933 [Pseudoalteromonas flavipulchra NCIMB 2033 = ATCC BAA-314]|nr:hypothetical protein [Pseudoalteromonas flavipulchra NCIMB 2033 = ATCC BAA-314]